MKTRNTTQATIEARKTTHTAARYWKWLTPVALTIFLYSCSNNGNQVAQQYKTLHEHDSLLMAKNQADDSTINGYIHNMNDVQNALDEIRTREKILRVNSNNESGSHNTAVQDIKSIDSLIIRSNREVNDMHVRLRRMNKKNADLESMVVGLSNQLNQQDSEITTLQNNLSKVNTQYAEVTRQFNDSITVLQNQNARVGALTTSINTVYYAIGTEKELKANKVITKEGGFIGIGKSTELTPDNNAAYFTKGDLTKINAISLNAKFKKLLTTHPAGSYRISGNKTADSLIITDRNAFWSEDKYLVVAVK